ncbi:MAG: hypothetical protein EOP46_01070 [Sphingobacteriaceae bacterium]|nr:MAG: hypothetical protein EOP46_01070 [Sphingobacteriaceae bacterium]
MLIKLKYIVYLLVANLLCCAAGYAQTHYKAGFAKTSIEPKAYPFSLALAGYGFPREGRFSLEWVANGTVTNCTALSGNISSLFAVNNGNLMRAKAGVNLHWTKLNSSAVIKVLTADNKNLYAVDDNGNFIKTKINHLAWEITASALKAVALTVLGHNIYMADSSGVISVASTKPGKISWRKISTLPNVISLTAHKGGLYALTANDDLMRLDLNKRNEPWLKIARYNGASYDVHLKFIAVAGDVLYGVDNNNSLFFARHLTTGNLSVTALAVTTGKQKVVIVGVDVCGLGYDFVSAVKHEITRKYHIPASALLINSSHTHFGPVAQHWPAWPEYYQQPDSAYLYGVVKGALVDAIAGALKNLAPSDLYFGRGKTAIGKNRVLTGNYVPYDNDVDVLSTVNKSTGLKTILFLTGCHAVFKNEEAESYTISANFPGGTRSALRKSANVANALFIQGCGGDINPVDENHTNTGNMLAADIEQILNKPMKKLDGDISFFMEQIDFPVKPWTKEQILAFKKENENDNKDVYAEKNVRWANRMLQLNKAGKIPSSMPVYVQTINIGSWKLVGLSREAVTDYSLGIKKLWPDSFVSVAGYCNDVSSYLPTSQHIKAATYEGLDSFFWYAQPSVFPESVYETLLNDIKTKNH